MSFNDISNNSEEFKVIRYCGFIYTTNNNLRAEGFKQLISIAASMNWVFYLEELTNLLKNDNYLSNNIRVNTPDDLSARIAKVVPLIEIINNYFAKLNAKDLQTECFKIKEYAKQYFDMGAFSQYISTFNRFLINMKNDFDESELHQYIIRYVVCCIVKRQFDLAISELSKLKQNYNNFDISIYVL